MQAYYEDALVTLYQGDVLDVLRRLPSASVHCCVTSPPYWGLRDYGVPGQIGLEPTPEEFIAKLVAVFREVRRVLRDDGTLWLNIGDSYNGSGGAGGDYAEGGLKEGQPKFPGRHLADLKPKDLIGIPWMLAFALRADGWWLRSDIIWCLSGGTKVYARTQKGDMPVSVKDLVRLDPSTVQLWNGERWTQVKGWYASPVRGEPLEIELRSGERIGCTAEHHWPTQRGVLAASHLKVGDVLLTTQLPEPDAPKMPAGLDDEDIGWLAGLYLAEGSKDEKAIHIASHTRETERFERCQRIALKYHGSCTWRANGGKSATISIRGKVLRAIIETYIAGADALTKRLTNACWERSNAFLRSLLEGYLHGDGGWDNKNQRWRLGFARNYAWESDLRTLCARLGIPIRLKMGFATMGGRKFPAFRGELRFTRSEHWNNRDSAEIVRIGYSRGRKFWDIEVEDEPHLFSLASGVLTHNSKPNPMPESVTDRPTKAHEYLFLLTKSQRYFYDAHAVREPAEYGRRVWSDAEANLASATTGMDKRQNHGVRASASVTGGDPAAGRNRRTVWTIATQSYEGAHFATFPEKLVEPCILAGTSERGCCPHPGCGAPWRRVVERTTDTYNDREGVAQRLRNAGASSGGTAKVTLGVTEFISRATLGWEPSCDCPPAEPVPCTVLDPFAGSGTSLMVARQLVRRGIGIDLSADYLDLAIKRVRSVEPGVQLDMMTTLAL